MESAWLLFDEYTGAAMMIPIESQLLLSALSVISFGLFGTLLVKRWLKRRYSKSILWVAVVLYLVTFWLSNSWVSIHAIRYPEDADVERCRELGRPYIMLRRLWTGGIYSVRFCEEWNFPTRYERTGPMLEVTLSDESEFTVFDGWLPFLRLNEFQNRQELEKSSQL